MLALVALVVLSVSFPLPPTRGVLGGWPVMLSHKHRLERATLVGQKPLFSTFFVL